MYMVEVFLSRLFCEFCDEKRRRVRDPKRRGKLLNPYILIQNLRGIQKTQKKSKAKGDCLTRGFAEEIEVGTGNFLP
jgi:hypothetical protein